MKFNISKFNPLVVKKNYEKEQREEKRREVISIEEVIRRYEEVFSD
jgi:hypothetical protein